MFGASCLLVLALIFLLLQSSRGYRISVAWASPLLLLLGAWTVAEIIWGWDSEAIKFLWNGQDGPGLSGFENVLRGLFLSPPTFLTLVQSFLRFFVLAALGSFFSSVPKEREIFLRGLELGLGVSTVLTTLMLIFPELSNLSHQDAFWTALNRAAGTFSDPNAFGIFVVLVLPVLVWRAQEASSVRKNYLYALLSVWLVLGAYSGSRSFFLGLGLYGLCYFAALGRKQVYRAVAMLLVVVCAFNLVAEYNPSTISVATKGLPQGLARLLDSISISNVDTTFFSRMAFWRIGWEMWLNNFFFGIGFEHFRDFVPEYARQLGLGIGTWTDNSNNFYLGLLAETGILGGIALVLSVAGLRWRSDKNDRFLQAPMLALVILLVFGPHFSFDEVVVLGALLLSLTCDFRPWRWSPVSYAVAALMVAGIILKSSLVSRGFYHWEQEAGQWQRWTSRTANGLAACDERGSARISIRALNPDIQTHPLTARAAAAGQVPQTFQLKNSDWHDVEFICPVLETVGAGRLPIRYSLEVDRLWVPKKFGQSADGRMLGLQVRQFAPITY